MNDFLSTKLTEYFLDEQEGSDYIKVKYYIESMLGELEKLLILLTIFGMFGYTKDIVLVMMVMLMIRPYTGGTHFDSYWLCFGYTALICYIAIFGGRMLEYNEVISICSYILMVGIIAFFTPICSKHRPVYVGEMRRNIKIKAMVSLCVVFAVNMLLEWSYRMTITSTIYILMVDIMLSYLKRQKNKGVK